MGKLVVRDLRRGGDGFVPPGAAPRPGPRPPPSLSHGELAK